MTFLYGLILLDGTIKSVCLTGSPRLPNNFPTNLLFNGRHETITSWLIVDYIKWPKHGLDMD
jgi:hypothetical protein